MDDSPKDERARVPESGWLTTMGIDVLSASPDEVVAEWEVDDRHKQPFGIVHGGVHCGAVESVCSIGALLHARQNGKVIVGVENHTSFIRAVRSGRLTATSRPLHKGARAQLWEANIVDEAGRLVATGRVRLFAVDP